MNNIYEELLPYVEKVQVSFDRYKLIISIENLIRIIANRNGTSYEEELSKFNEYFTKKYDVTDLTLNEFDEYEEIKD